MRIRMLPVNSVFSRFPRMVHDISGKLGKQVELRISGEQTELDKTVIEKIGDPLVHLIRNSLDHGLESIDERVQAGKPETGVIALNAYHKSGSIFIEVSDDGRGLNRDALLRKGLDVGLLRAGEDYSDEQIYDLIFHPGLSTAKQISDVSGRGVGMDVVRRNIQDVGGSIQIVSQPGRGTQITICLPLTLAILDGQLVTDPDLPRRFAGGTIEPDLATAHCIAGKAARLEEARSPEPFVDTDAHASGQQLFSGVQLLDTFPGTDQMDLRAIDHDFSRTRAGVVVGRHRHAVRASRHDG